MTDTTADRDRAACFQKGFDAGYEKGYLDALANVLRNLNPKMADMEKARKKKKARVDTLKKKAKKKTGRS